MKRAKHNLSHYRLQTCNIGDLLPIACVPVLPGDTVQHATSAMLRLSPLNTPVMHPTSVRIHHFFVPNRITWPEWEDFITGGNDGTAAPAIPTIALTDTKGSWTDHIYACLGQAGGEVASALPLYAANLIYNEYYRDQDLITERAEDDTSMPKIAWEKDYFGVARPFTQKGPDVTLPLSGQADVSVGSFTAGDFPATAKSPDDFWRHVSDGVLDDSSPARLGVDLTGVAAPSVNDFRAAFSIQRYQEARARYGSRFTEYLRYLGIRPSDARLQRPEYLSGGTARVNFSEVLQTSEKQEDPAPVERGIGVGDMYGHGIAGVRSNRYRKFFEEHGYIISMMSARPKALYVNGLHREFNKKTKEDFFQKELANLGQQEVFASELYNSAANQSTVFGFTDRYEEYRNHPSAVTGDFRDTLNPYHMGRDLDPAVALNQSFIECSPSDRIFQVGEETANTLWCFINHKMVSRRIVPKRANPRIL